MQRFPPDEILVSSDENKNPSQEHSSDVNLENNDTTNTTPKSNNVTTVGIDKRRRSKKISNDAGVADFDNSNPTTSMSQYSATSIGSTTSERDEAIRRLETEVRTFTMLRNGTDGMSPKDSNSNSNNKNNNDVPGTAPDDHVQQQTSSGGNNKNKGGGRVNFVFDGDTFHDDFHASSSAEQNDNANRDSSSRQSSLLDPPSQTSSLTESTGGRHAHNVAGRRQYQATSRPAASPIQEASSTTSTSQGNGSSPNKGGNNGTSPRVFFKNDLEDVDDSTEYQQHLKNQQSTDNDDAVSVASRVSQMAGSVARVAGAFATFVVSGTTMIEEEEDGAPVHEHQQSQAPLNSFSSLGMSPQSNSNPNHNNVGQQSGASLLISPSRRTTSPTAKSPTDAMTSPSGDTNRGIATDVNGGTAPVEPELDDIAFLHDNPRDMTYGRRIARHFAKSTWYHNPQAVREAQEAQRRAFRSEREEEMLLQAKTEEGAAGGVGDGSSPEDRVFDEAYRPPNLDMAWAHFEHVTLPRYVVPSLKNAQMASITIPESAPTGLFGKLKRLICGSAAYDNLKAAEPGESQLETKLYSVYYTPLSQMGDFGLGIGLYFSTLQALTILTLLAGLISIPNLTYYKSTAYSALGQVGLISTPSLGSAICTDQIWVPCEDCTFAMFRPGVDDSRLAIPEDSTSAGFATMSFALKNNCLGAQMPQGMVNLAALLFLFSGMVIMNVYQQRKAVEFDEDEQTAQDYSICVHNPPKDAYDPEEWKKYFEEKFATRVTVCTVVVANDLLLQALAERRERLRQLELLLPVGESMELNHIARLSAEMSVNRHGIANLLRCLHPFGFCMDLPALYERIVVLTERARGLAQRRCPVTKIFVTFETEEDQRTVLSTLSYGKFTSIVQQTSKVSPEYLFRGQRVLSVSEPSEPSAVRWQNLDDNLKRQFVSVSITTFVCLAAVILIAFIVALCRDRSAQFAAIAIAGFNAIFPTFALAMTSLESHAEEGLKERSLYIKIAVFRWINTAVVMNLVTPFTSTLTEGSEHLVYAVYAIFFAEIVTANALQLLDIGGQIKRHFLAPRAPDQERMNLNFQGTQFFLAERYTTVTKILFLNFYYASVFPGTFFFSSVAFALNYIVDKFSLMRTWTPAPKLGKQVADFSRKYFFSAAIVAFAFISSYAFSGFPYDNLCDTGKVTDGTGQYFVYIGEERSKNTTVTVSQGDPIYKFCNQNYFSKDYPTVAFPALPDFQPPDSKWMTPSQEKVTTIYGWTSIAFISLFFVVFCYRLAHAAYRFFSGGYSANGSDMNINFSDVEVIDSYIPQVKNENYSYPFIACNIDDIPMDLMSWRDPTRSYDFYNLYKDAMKLFDDGTMYEVHPHAFSRIVHWSADDLDDAPIARPYEKNMTF